MSLINMAKREINCKIVYYGIGLSGKTTNLQYLHSVINPRDIGEMVSIDTETERTLYFDLLPLDMGKIHGFQIRFQLYTVPGQVLYKQTRNSVLKGADSVAFIVDSQRDKLEENIESWNELQDQLTNMGKDLDTFPIVMQWNKRDMEDVISEEELDETLNVLHVPAVSAIAPKGTGVIETLKIAINNTLKTLERE